MEIEKTDIILSGWIIEQSTDGEYWSQQINRKLYSNETIATKALEEIIKTSYWMRGDIRDKIKYRMTPIYKLSPALERWMTINTIIE